MINARGAISLRRNDGAGDTQRLRLEAEGVAFGAAGRVSLARFQWQPPASRFGSRTARPIRTPRLDPRRALG